VSAVARIGPNAILQVDGALRAAYGDDATGDLFRAAGLERYLREPPTGMVDEREVIRLHATLRARLAPPDARRIAREAGLATGDYLLAHRIPRAAQRVLAVLPAPLAARVLLAAIARHAWTFAGSGRYAARAGRPVVVTIGDCPLCRGVRSVAPQCEYYAATFERLFRTLVAPHAHVVETRCRALGAEACTFEIAW
jgi:divinyl protochlorophyllide a 8-vinyl-reductase